MRCACILAVAGLVVAGSRPAMSAGETRHVLVLYSNGRMLPANVDADRGLQEVIAAGG